MRLQRITSGGRFIPQVDGLRFIAISLVVAYHLQFFAEEGSVTQRIFAQGNRGVELFFVLSGFILGLPFAKHYLLGDPKPNIPRYFLRRLTRLEPPYILSLLLCFAVIQFVHLPASHGSVGVSHLLASLTYTHNVVFGTYSSISPVAWSLEIEIQFYLLMPLLARLYSLRVRRALLIAAIGIFSVIAFYSQSARLHLSLAGSLQFFLAGMLLADLFVAGLPRRSYWWDALLIMWLPIVLTRGNLLMAYLPFLCLFLYISAFAGPITSRVLSLRPLTTIGGMCYSIYLLHYQLIWICFHWIHLTNKLLLYSARICVVALPCLIFFVLIERPYMRPEWSSVLWSRISPSPYTPELRKSSVVSER